ncbi:cytochrome c oxidase assembly protein, partial [Streptomyces toxytricini]
LAKGLYAVPPPGLAVAAGDLRAGAVLMYYGGDAVEIALASVLAVQWYAATGRARRRALRRRTAFVHGAA